MPDWLHRTDDILLGSLSPVDLPEAAVNYIQDPDLSAVVGEPIKYWKRNASPDDTVTLMNQTEKDAKDAAIVLAANVDIETVLASEPDNTENELSTRVRALIELFNKRDNYLVNRISELQDAMDAMKASTGAAQNIRDAIPASWLATNTRTKADAIADYKADITAGNQRA